MTELANAIAQDARELRRGVLVTYLGYGLKLGMPVLLALATRTYGAERWGEFLAAQAVVLILVRVCLLGLDKGLLWSAARERGAVLHGIPVALLYVALTSGCTALALWLGLSRLLASDGRAAEVLRVAALAVPPYALSELLLHATMGRRRMELQVIVRETVNPLAQVLTALLLFRLGAHELGLAWAFVIAQLIGLALAAVGFARLFRDTPWASAETLRLPPDLVRYAGPLWLAEITNSVSLRLDTLALAALTDPVTVGIWGIVAQFANALRQIRRAYDPVVTALAARIGVERDSARLSATLSYAAQMVSLAQLPLFAFLFVFADYIMPLYGPGFARGTTPLMVLSTFFLLSGGAGLAGLIVTGYGHTRLTLLNVVLGALLQVSLLGWLVPQHGLVGAALAVGMSLCAINLLQLLELRTITGSFHYTRRSAFSLAVLVLSGGATVVCGLLSSRLSLGAWQTRAAAMLGFSAVYASLCGLGLHKGYLRAPDGRGDPDVLPLLAQDVPSSR